MEILLTSRLSTLSHPQRLSIFRLLMRRCPDEITAGEIAHVLELKASTASVYLSALTQTGLISQRREGTRLLYAVNLAAAGEVVSGLFVDCCRGRPDLCPPQFSQSMAQQSNWADKKRNVLFVCSGNSARSIFAEAILRDIAGDRFNAYSAGTAHGSELNPFAVEVLRSKAHDVSLLRSDSISDYNGESAPQMDFVFTVCDLAANQDSPAWTGQPILGHWGMPDPVKAEGTNAEKKMAFQQTYRALHRRLSRFTALPLAEFDRASLQRTVDEIGKETATQE
ncbi:MAG: helix-turn-helix domain-containing protein [Sulfitobacter sp.]